MTKIETPKLSTHIYVFICSSVAEIRGTAQKTDGGRGVEEDGQSKKTRDVAPENFNLFGAFLEEHATLKLTPMEEIETLQLHL